MYYRSVDDLPITILFKIFEQNDLRLLSKEYSNRDKIPKKELESAWESILESYKELDTSNIVERVVRKSQYIDFLKAKYQMVSLCVYVLRLGRNREVEMRLKKAGYEVDIYDFKNSLNSIEYLANGLKTKIGIKESELKLLTKDDEVAKTDINKMLASMSSALQIPFKFNELTVVEFFGYKSALEEKAKRDKRQQLKSKAHGRR